MKNLCQDVRAEYQALDDFVSGLREEQSQLKTPFYDWTIFDEIAHIAFVDKMALWAITDADAFKADPAEFAQTIANGASMPAVVNPQLAAESFQQLLEIWRQLRDELLSRLENMNPKDRLPWYGPDMSARSFATARLMETWAHGQDIYDCLQQCRTYNNESTANNLKHVAHIGISTFAFSYTVKNMQPPNVEFFVQLQSPRGDNWIWGDESSCNRLTGKAEDFCLVASQRRHLSDTTLEYQGEVMRDWLLIAQCFAGGASMGPKPGVRVV